MRAFLSWSSRTSLIASSSQNLSPIFHNCQSKSHWPSITNILEKVKELEFRMKLHEARCVTVHDSWIVDSNPEHCTSTFRSVFEKTFIAGTSCIHYGRADWRRIICPSIWVWQKYDLEFSSVRTSAFPKTSNITILVRRPLPNHRNNTLACYRYTDTNTQTRRDSLTKRCLTVNTVHASLVSRCSHLEIWTFFHESVVPALSCPVDAGGVQVSMFCVRLAWTEDTVFRQRPRNNFTYFPTCWWTAYPGIAWGVV